MTENELVALVKKMTLKQKLGQLAQCGRSIYTDEMKVSEETKEMVRQGMIGSFLSVSGVETLNELQKVAVEESELKIPLFFGHDIIHGYRTIFPLPAGEACSFEPELAKKTCIASAKEMRANGIHITWAPMVDVARDQRWGRGLEGAGEDVYVHNVFAKARVKGFHNNGIDKNDSVACCAKHYVAYGAVEGGRDYNGVDMSDERLYNTYLPPFKAAVECGVDFIMTAFHEYNGVPCTVNKRLLVDILRKELGFKGVVISDAGSLLHVKAHGYAKDEEDLSAQAMNNGLDIEMGTQIYSDGMKSAMEKGRVSVEQIDEAVLRILKFKNNLGLFENPYADEKKAQDVLLTKESRELAVNAAKRSIVLLENNGILPLENKQTKIAVIGKIANDPFATLGAWVCVEPKKAQDEAVTLFEGLKKEYDNITYSQAYDYIDNNQKQTEMIKNGSYDFVFTNDELIENAVENAKKADVIIFAAGEPPIMNGEAKSRADITLPNAQKKVFERLKLLGKKIITVVVSGRPLVLENEAKKSDALFFTYSLGTEMGTAFAEVLTGKYNPSAKLTSTVPSANGQCPTMYYSHNNTGQPANDDIWWTSKYIDVSKEPLYPFGYGKSYTEFEYLSLKTDKEIYKTDDCITLDVTVRNVGDRDGEEVIQIYVRDLIGSIVRPIKELKAFKKVMIKKGEEKTVTFKIDVRELGFYNHDKEYIVENGEFEVFTGGDSSCTMKKIISVE